MRRDSETVTQRGCRLSMLRLRSRVCTQCCGRSHVRRGHCGRSPDRRRCLSVRVCARSVAWSGRLSRHRDLGFERRDRFSRSMLLPDQALAQCPHDSCMARTIFVGSPPGLPTQLEAEHRRGRGIPIDRVIGVMRRTRHFDTFEQLVSMSTAWTCRSRREGDRDVTRSRHSSCDCSSTTRAQAAAREAEQPSESVWRKLRNDLRCPMNTLADTANDVSTIAKVESTASPGAYPDLDMMRKFADAIEMTSGNHGTSPRERRTEPEPLPTI